MYPDQLLLSQVAIVLVRPKFAENIGSTARVAFNMGIKRLILVHEIMPDRAAMAKMATHKAAHLLDNMEIHDNLEEALKPFSVIVGTTARTGKKRTIERTPREIIETIIPDLPNNQLAIIFGPEDRGLTNDELKYCNYTSSIPTADFSSLNLAQAVAIHCYELYYNIVHAPRAIEPNPKIASSYELEGMYDYLEETLLRIDFLQEKSHTYWMTNIRQFLSRIRITSKDSKIIRGICRQFLCYQGRGQEK
ncbi:RNA methyltransferase [Desulfosediminicola flagellatus]|uniref:RNA methyltransferase n=1 Tax=Desulfosediminicola flagellatus TaxID=2569541 RepID=UPI0010AB818B|nr:RNA methyltransferase [Desulfosediminicola flagellatus]